MSRPNSFALIDCNNFFVSCERAFNPKLQNKPVIILSSNDGCAVSRSNEAKSLGIPMGVPLFKIKDIVRKHKVECLSSNFSLYSNISSRIMSILKEESEKLEIYSIDEAFLELPDIKNESLEKFGSRVKEKILKWTGIPVSVGIAPTKTLAKIATEIVKNYPRLNGVLDLTKLNQEQVDSCLKTLDVSDVWGIGRQSSKFLKAISIKTALDLKNADEKILRKKLSVVGERTILELRGTSCISLNKAPARKSIISTQSFGKPVYDYQELEQAICLYMSRACEKLRSQNSTAKKISIFITTKSKSFTSYKYTGYDETKLPYPTANTSTLTKAAISCLKKIYKPGFKYKKAGVGLDLLQPKEELQFDILEKLDPEKDEINSKLMYVIDSTNKKWGSHTVKLASQGIDQPWHMKQKNRSKRFLTSWNELLIANTDLKLTKNSTN